MRRSMRIVGTIVLVGVLVIAATVVWVDRALASTLKHPEALCLRPEDRAMIALGAFPEDRKDYLVSKAVNFKVGVPPMLWWHVRGATIQLTYVTFWSPTKRDRAFNRLTSQMRDCPLS